MDKKSLCAVIDIELHNKIREQQTAQEITLTEYIENAFRLHLIMTVFIFQRKLFHKKQKIVYNPLWIFDNFL